MSVLNQHGSAIALCRFRSSRRLDEANRGLHGDAEVAPTPSSNATGKGMAAAGEPGWHQRWERERRNARAEENPGRYHSHSHPSHGNSCVSGSGTTDAAPADWGELLWSGGIVGGGGGGGGGAGTPVLPSHRLLTALLLRAALESESSLNGGGGAQRSPASSMAGYGMLLPLLPQPQLEAMCPLREATATLRAVLSDSPANQVWMMTRCE